MKALEIKSSLLLDLVFTIQYNTIISWFLLLIIYLYFLAPVVIVQIFYPTAELAIPTGTPTKEAKAGLEAHPVTAETKISKCSI